MRWVIAVVVAACSVPPYAGHDEDGDGIPDDVDPCPHIAGALGSTDRDGDGIGDACDPFPDDPNDTRYFFAFGVDTGNLAITANAALSADALELGTVGETFDSAWIPGTLHDVVAAIGFHVLGRSTTAMYDELGLRTRYTPTMPGQVISDACFIGQAIARSTAYTESQETYPMSPKEMYMDLSYALDDVAGRLTVTAIGGNFTCVLADVMTMPPIETQIQSGQPPGQVGVTATGLRVRIDYLFVAGR